MSEIESMLTGEIGMAEFLLQLKNKAELRGELNGLIPNEARYHPDHPLWKNIAYEFLKKDGFDLYVTITSFAKVDGSIAGSLGESLNIFDTIRTIYSYSNPSLQCTTQYHDAYDLYLDAVGEYYGGPEVEALIDEVIRSCLDIRLKGQRIKAAKQKVVALFHTEDRKRPYWIQGAEWPMGINTPMKYIRTKKAGESRVYLFQDVDTAELREVIQYF